ncbi:MAG TPA: phosphatase PAP2 family protein [Verrucomicrobiae bacterium]
MKKIYLKFTRRFASVLFLFALAVAPLRAAQTVYLTDGQPHALALLAPPPLPYSAEQKYDLAEVISVHAACASNEIAAAMSEDKGVSMFYFTPAIGKIFQPGNLPRTQAFLERVHSDAQSVVNQAKNYWQRPRPYVVDPDLATGKQLRSFSYPSGHSTESMALALVLADLFPDQREPILAEAREIGWHRVEIARHYPMDIVAGRVLAQALVRDMKRNPQFKKDFAEAQAEIAAAQTAKN